MSGWLTVSAVVMAGCTFTANPGHAPGDATGPGSEPAGPDAANPVPDSPPAPPDAPPDSPTLNLGCPVTYNQSDSAHPGSLYRIATASATWQAAETDCEDDATLNLTLPAHLIVLDDAAEAQWIWDQDNTQQWIGVTDVNTEGTFVAVTDQPTVFTGIANGNANNKDCLSVDQISSAVSTAADSCGGGHPYVCECDGRAADPSHF